MYIFSVLPVAAIELHRPVKKAGLHPIAQRYKEIQNALTAKGYRAKPASGVWDRDSVSALQRFQEDQKLEPTGRLDARSCRRSPSDRAGQKPPQDVNP
jgi:hypothetical protein